LPSQTEDDEADEDGNEEDDEEHDDQGDPDAERVGDGGRTETGAAAATRMHLAVDADRGQDAAGPVQGLQFPVDGEIREAPFETCHKASSNYGLYFGGQKFTKHDYRLAD